MALAQKIECGNKSNVVFHVNDTYAKKYNAFLSVSGFFNGYFNLKLHV